MYDKYEGGLFMLHFPNTGTQGKPVTLKQQLPALVADLEAASCPFHQTTGGRADYILVYTTLNACRFLFGWDRSRVSGDCKL